MRVEGGGRVTIAAIAREAGVSVPTVSRVVNGRGDVSPETRTRIERLLRDHGYQRRPQRRADKAHLIDLVFNDLDTPWALEIVRGVEEAAHAAGFGAVVSAVRGRSSSTHQWLHNVRTRASDGVILVTTVYKPELQSELRRLGVPAVVIDPAGNPSLDVPTVGATNWTGGIDATEHLLALGHRRIGFIGGPPKMMCSRARLDGYRTAMDGAGLSVEGLVREGRFDYESGFAGGTELLALDDPPTAVFAASDLMALGLYEAVRRRGLRIPEDVSVVGFDDLPNARWASPPLTTVRQPLAEMGLLAVRTVLRLVEGENIESPRVELATGLVMRDSTGAP